MLAISIDINAFRSLPWVQDQEGADSSSSSLLFEEGSERDTSSLGKRYDFPTAGGTTACRRVSCRVLLRLSIIVEI